MKIGIVTTWFERGAAYVSRQFEEVWSVNHEVFIYARGGEEFAKGNPKWDKDNVTWDPRHLLSTPTEVNISHFKKWIETNELDMVFFNEQNELRPVLESIKMDILTGAYIDYYKQDTIPFFKIYDFLICNTRRHYSVFEWHPQCFYIPWGTNLELYKPVDEKSGKITFFNSAGMNPHRKGTDLVLRAFDKIDRTKSKLIIHTQVDLILTFPELNLLVEKFLKEKSLLIENRTVSAPGLYHLGDVYVYPSRLDGIGLTVAEAISSGLPAIVTDEEPMKEFVKSKSAGRLVKVETTEKRKDGYFWPQSTVNLEHLIEQMNYYIDNTQDVNYLKKEARKYAEENLDWVKNLLTFEEKLNSLQKINFTDKEEVIRLALSYEKHHRLKYLLINNRSSFRMRILLKKFKRIWKTRKHRINLKSNIQD